MSRALALAPSTVATAQQYLVQVLTAAVDDGLIARSPAAWAKLPRNDAPRPEPAQADVLEAIAELPAWARVAVPLGLELGLRQNEATGLTVDPVQFLRRVVRIDRQHITNASASPDQGPVKTSSSNRTNPLAQFVTDAIAAHLAERGEGEHRLVLHLPDGRQIGRSRFGRIRRAARGCRSRAC
jgi:integrase